MRTLIIGVAGGTGSGKTTISRRIMKQVGMENVVYLQHDSYYKDRSYLPPVEREDINYDHPEALETSLLIAHLKSLASGEAVAVPIYDFTTHTRKHETQYVKPRPVVLLEGILIFVDEDLRNLMDIKVFVDTDADTRFIRRLRRDTQERDRSMDSVIRQYEDTVKPMHLEFVEPSKRYADIIIPEGGLNNVGVDMLVTKIKSLLRFL